MESEIDEKIQDYIDEKKELQNVLLCFIQEENDEQYFFLEKSINKENFKDNFRELRLFLYLLQRIANDFHRSTFFFEKIEKVFKIIFPHIKTHLNNSEIFDIFSKNKRMLLLLIQNQILQLDDDIISRLEENIDINGTKFCHFFYPEIKNFEKNKEKVEQIEKELLEIDENIFDKFEEKRKIGENDSFICGLMRNDSIEDFISHISRNNLSLSGKIKTSIFETNYFLLKNKNPSLIEYASFFGSIQIFQYLQINKIELTPSLPLYAIHGRNAQIIHVLESIRIITEENNISCLICAIKCHHNDFADYFNDKYLNNYEEESPTINESMEFIDNVTVYDYIFHYYNYHYFPEDHFESYISYFCQYDYYTLVKYLLKYDKDFKFGSIVLKYLFCSLYFNLNFKLDFKNYLL